MKLIFKILVFLLFMSGMAHARDIIIIDHIHNLAVAKTVHALLINKFNMPKAFIRINESETQCQRSKESIMHLCVKENGDLDVINLNNYLLKSSFNIFLEKKE